MHPVIAIHLRHHHELEEALFRDLDGLDPAALDRCPAGGRNPLGALAWHMAGSLSYWLLGMMAGRPTGEDHAAELAMRGLTLERLRERYRDVLSRSAITLDGLTPDDLGTTRTNGHDSGTFPVAWILTHTLRHTAHHGGQVSAIAAAMKG